MANASEIIAMAVSQIGTKESPAGSNTVIYNTEYYDRAVKGAAYPWCCTFVWWVFKHCNASSLFCYGRKVASCTAVKNYMVAQIVSNPQPGDIVLFQFDKDAYADHIGILEKVNADGTYTTIEGNTSVASDDNGGCVMRRIRKKSLIMCFIRPKYDAVNMTAKEEFVRAVQSAIGATVDGVAGNETLSKTVTVSAKKNNRHAVVKPIQTYLNSLGFDCGTADGVAGSKFTKAVKAFQTAQGCFCDGEVTAKGKTWRKLLGLA